MQPPPRPASPDKDEEELDRDLWQYEAPEEHLELRATKKPRREAAADSRGVGGFINLAQMAGFKELLTETIREALPAREAPLEFNAAKDPAIESVQTVLKKIADAPDQGKLGGEMGADLDSPMRAGSLQFIGREAQCIVEGVTQQNTQQSAGSSM
jgi:hypothetical protein